MDRIIRTQLVSQLLGAILCCMAIGTGSFLHAADSIDSIERLSIDAGQNKSEGTFKGVLTLSGSEARRQLIVTGYDAQGKEVDLTRTVNYLTLPEGIAHVSPDGLITPLSNGMASVTARTESGITAQLPVIVSSFEVNPPVDFNNQVIPILTKYGCNGGGCHGAARGQNGFMLSLLGFEPDHDVDHIARESRGRRISLTAPDESLFLKKAVGSVPHGGGARIEFNSPEYLLLRRWIAEGARDGDANAPTVTGISVFPSARMMQPDSEQQLLVLATYSDGTVEDVTPTARYEANAPTMATITPSGLVTTGQQTGDVGVMIRYQSHVAVFQATIPLGIPVESLPPIRNVIDEHVFAKLKLLGLPPSEICDDATFVRRVTIDLAGRLPTVAETTEFLADNTPDKRDRLIERLLDSPDYAAYFTNKWSLLLKNQPERYRMEQTSPGTYLFHHWITQALQENRPYDQFVRQILTASGEPTENPPVMWYRAERDPTTQVEDVMQLFLGQRIQCAKCHHHPFERWSQDDYYRLTAFFSQIGRKPGLRESEERIFHRVGLATAVSPRTGATLQPAGLGAEPLELPPEVDPRIAMVDWMTSPENPYFAKALVNRYWKHFFGRGLVDPEDDMRATNPPVNAELLAALEQHFIQNGFDLKDLIRLICQSSTYQLSSEPNETNQDDRQNFSRFYPRRLTAEVLLEAVDTLTESPTQFTGMPAGTRAVELPHSRFSSYFLTVFGRPLGESVSECERDQESNLAQSLHLINSPEMTKKATEESGRANRLAGTGDVPMLEKIRELYLTAFSREPHPEEIDVITEYLKQRQLPDGSENREAYEDIIWSLINSKEFLFNH